MAASVVGVGVGFVLIVAGVVMAFWVRELERRVERLEANEHQRAMPAPVMGDDVTTKLLDRLLDAALPARTEAPEPEGTVRRSDAEYEPPIEPVQDWTDPFFGMERPLVGGLAPGQGIPGIGQQADQDEWGGDETQAYVEDMQEQAERDRAVGEALFNDWDAQRGGMPR